MKLITRKSECRRDPQSLLVKSPKEAIRKTLNNYVVKDGVIVKIYQPSYISKEEIVLRGEHSTDITIKLHDHSFATPNK
jgi:hypothetical protein